MHCSSLSLPVFATLLFAATCPAQSDILYYKFDAGGGSKVINSNPFAVGIGG